MIQLIASHRLTSILFIWLTGNIFLRRLAFADPIKCDFNQEDGFCGWQPESDAGTKWAVKQDPLDNRYAATIDYNIKQPMEITLESEFISGISGTICIGFVYSFHGYNPGTVQLIYISDKPAAVWTRSGSHGYVYRPQLVELNLQGDFEQLRFKLGQVAPASGTFSLRTIEIINNGPCPDPSSGNDYFTDFEKDLGPWSIGQSPLWSIDKGVQGEFPDHTTGTLDGFDLQLAKSTSGNEASVTTSMALMANESNCLNFYTFWTAQDIFNTPILRIYAEPTDGLNSMLLLNYTTDDLKNTWQKIQVNLPEDALNTLPNGFNFRIGAVHDGDNITTALDDIRIMQARCKSPFQCNWELESCGYQSSSMTMFSMDFAWLSPADTSAPPSAPTTDHTLGTRFGHYLFLNAEGLNKTTVFEVVESPLAFLSDHDNDTCVEVFYQLGDDLALEIAVGLGEVHIYEATKGEWQRARVPIKPYRYPYRLEFHITSYGPNPTFVAIDDVMLLPGHFCETDTTSTSSETTSEATTTQESNGDVNEDWIIPVAVTLSVVGAVAIGAIGYISFRYYKKRQQAVDNMPTIAIVNEEATTPGLDQGQA